MEVIWPLSWAWTTLAWQERAEAKARENRNLREQCDALTNANITIHTDWMLKRNELAMYKRFVANLRLDQDELQSRMDEAR